MRENKESTQLLWANRMKLANSPTKEGIEKWVKYKQKSTNKLIHIDEHPTDGWVAYLQIYVK